MNEKKHIHLIGICGTAMASLAGMLEAARISRHRLRRRGLSPMSDFLRELGIPVAQPFDAKNLEPGPTWSSSATPCRAATSNSSTSSTSAFHSARCRSCCMTNFCAGKKFSSSPELTARPRRLRCWPGSSTPPGWIRSFLIGGIAENFGSSFHLGAGKHFILEGDEYDTAFFDKGPKFLHYFPDSVILTSVEFDHADIYKDLDAVETAFKRLVNLIPRRGRIVAFDGVAGEATESPSLERCLAKAFCPVERYGAGPRANWKVTNLRFEPARTSWTVLHDGQPWADFEFPLAGEYNVWNATAAAALAASLRNFRKMQLPPR